MLVGHRVRAQFLRLEIEPDFPFGAFRTIGRAWAMLLRTFSPKSPRNEPMSAFWQSVAPLSLRPMAIAFSPSQTINTHGPDVMNDNSGA